LLQLKEISAELYQNQKELLEKCMRKVDHLNKMVFNKKEKDKYN